MYVVSKKMREVKKILKDWSKDKVNIANLKTHASKDLMKVEIRLWLIHLE